ncbi:uncharacterized protein LOC120426073 [Culex pipiens pallens]|uniref:uncharacterized protein LOC120426073 n=1 Tax=Culex pipiens pallens TaxID=42434 RepID=UPI0019539622|nr:uncharacterized protein LOC120426073 [Culex pipiens pallens]
MKILTTVLLIFVAFHPTFAYNEEALSYVLRAIEYLASVHAGAFSCVLYDVAPQHPFDNILEGILQAPRLEHVTKYVVNGSKAHPELDDIDLGSKLSRKPLLLVLYIRKDFLSFANRGTKRNISNFFYEFDPTTKVLVLFEHGTRYVVQEIMDLVQNIKFTYSVLLDIQTMAMVYDNGLHYRRLPKVPHPMFLFETGRRWMAGHKIRYISDPSGRCPWTILWLKETARYLHTEVYKIQHNCSIKSSDGFIRCLKSLPNGRGNFDLMLIPGWITPYNFKYYYQVITKIPVGMRIAVPRERPFNYAELILMPFTGLVWTVLVAVIVSSELVKHFYPEHFKNDPFLLAVCGFERHNLHQAGRWEKIIFLSLIIMMFFVTNAFETKIVSFMTNRPSPQRIKTLDDVLNSDVKFYADYESNPHFKRNFAIGKMLSQGTPPDPFDNTPGVGVIEQSDFVETIQKTVFDYERMQLFYVLVDYISFEGPEAYMANARSLFLEPFSTVHERLVEAGLFTYWERDWMATLHFDYSGLRPREDFSSKTDLNFDDLQLAWIVLAIGFGFALLGFLGEHGKKLLDSWRESEHIQQCLRKCKTRTNSSDADN